MSTSRLFHAPLNNQLLLALPRADYARILDGFEQVELIPGRVLYEVTDTIRHAYFPLSGMISLLASTENGSTIEIAMVGKEGMVGLPMVLGTYKTPYRITVQVRGRALKIRSNPLRAEFDRCGRLHDILLRYTSTVLTQISQSAVCNHFHTAEQRLCRWLLVTQDRTHLNEFNLTQEVISHMIGIPRTHVTKCALSLQERGLIRYSRGRIAIINLRGLEAASCECFRTVKEEIDSFLAA
jgi:CRP-like cAMP-binding protein